MNVGFKIITDFDRPEQVIVDKCKKYCSAVIADNMNRNFCLNSSIKKVNKKQFKMVGTAFTIKTKVVDNLLVHKSLELAKPGDVVVVDAEGDTEHAILGEIMVEEAKSCGLAGFLIDGAIRDIDEIGESDYPVFAKGATPQGPFKEGPGEINVPISCGGVVINPGDIIVGDDDGVVVVPQQYAEEIIKKADAKQKREQDILENIAKDGVRDKSWVDEILLEKGCEIIKNKKE